MNFWNSLGFNTQELDEDAAQQPAEEEPPLRRPTAADLLTKRGYEVRLSFARICNVGPLGLICLAVAVDEWFYHRSAKWGVYPARTQSYQTPPGVLRPPSGPIRTLTA